ncbi:MULTISPECIES: CaiB/BaiF CoA transferase family protein [unclassified Sphingomonas]|uniref:CaiB/BaiF CoA transferase family protein n=1 Tax=unclassified Sphingomonas TaxID=196159 RepID=UPI0006F62461|nr:MULTISPECIES: CaiB/BaiF CoA-transferase family protein [unclassified Sphingomonas]KQX18588.1 carnitine dehydratase [Sphingomonas sp. Root1294]KQY72088.1 carnitine dehydratase [Sphingomonas sp. Root50]KRB94642.1 carnitine dehydratase [Sphingomonas sp. Root720]
MSKGPLEGLRVIEFAGIGPGPFCAMLLSDLGAEVLRIERPEMPRRTAAEVTRRGRPVLRLDLKDPAAVDTALGLVENSDALIEGFRPGVMERLGLGPNACLKRNPALVYGRMTGYGQTGPLAQRAGHDINYISISGALSAIGTTDHITPPLNLVGDYGGGAMFLTVGLLAGVLHARTTGTGQVVDAAMSDGAAALMSQIYGFLADGRWQDERATNFLDGTAPYYGTYRCADGEFLAVGCIEPQFYQTFFERIGVAAPLDERNDRSCWPALRLRTEAAIAGKPLQHWADMFADVDACVAPVLSMRDAPNHPHNIARGSFTVVDGVTQPSPLPRFSVTPGAIQKHDGDCRDILARRGLSQEGIARLYAAGAL